MITRETLEEADDRLLRGVAAARFDVLPRLYACENVDGPRSADPDALACVKLVEATGTGAIVVWQP